MNKFTSRIITAVLAAGTVAGKHPLKSQPLHVRNLRRGTKGDQSIRLTRNDKAEMRDEKHRLRRDDGYGVAALTNNLYSGTIFVGTGTTPVAQELTVSFSIEGDLTFLSDSTCTTCGTGTLFDTSLSSSYDCENTTETT